MEEHNGIDILIKKNEYHVIGSYNSVNTLLIQDCFEVIYSDDDVTIIKDKERKDIFIYHKLKEYGVQVKYTHPVTIYRKDTIVLYANKYGEKLKIGAYVKNIDNFHHIVSNGEKELEVSFVILYKSNKDYLGKPLTMEIMKKKISKDDCPMFSNVSFINS